MRVQLPAYSPVSARALVRAGRGVLRLGSARPALEAELRARFDAGRVVLCASGTDALERAIRLAWRAYGETAPVALPAYGCYDMATAAVGARSRITLYDVDPATLSPDLDSLRGALRSGARVVVIASLYGMPYDWDAVARLCDEFGAVPIEDVAQGAGALWRGRPLGTRAPLAILSFGRGKGWSGGRGGALLVRGRELEGACDDTLIAPRATAEMSTVVRAGAQYVLGRPALFGVVRALPWLHIGETRYRDPAPAADMPRAAAEMVLSTADAAVAECEQRRVNAEFLRAMIPGGGELRHIDLASDGIAGWLRFPLLVRGGLSSLGAEGGLVKRGIARGYPSPLGELAPVRARLLVAARPLPGASLLVRDLVTLPTHSLLTAREVTDLASCVTRSAGGPATTLPAAQRGVAASRER